MRYLIFIRGNPSHSRFLAQLEKCVNFVNKEKREEDGIAMFNDATHVAPLPKREELKKLLHEVQRGDVVVIDQLSSISTDSEELITIYSQIVRKGATIYSVQEHHVDEDNFRFHLLMQDTKPKNKKRRKP